MTSRLLVAALLLFLAAACGDDDGTCPPGSVPAGGRCIETTDAGDAGDFDIGHDAPDTGACPMTCTPPAMCDPDLGACVACTGDTDCDATAPACNDAGECVSCDGDDTLCTRFTSTPLCSTDDGACVACNEAADCPSAAMAACVDHTCAPCMSDLDCTGPDQNVCLTEGPDMGTCVQCSGADETACGSFVCDVAAGTCTDIPERAALFCQECVSDRQCPMGQLCVTTRFDGEDVPGRFCLWPREATGVGAPGGACITIAPYVNGFDAAGTADPTPVRICGLATTTCPALADFSMTPCDAPGEDTADQCGIVGLDDGYCAEFPDSGGMNRCTVPCASGIDCTTNTCLSATTSICGFTITPRPM